jgi:hypothetical protein
MTTTILLHRVPLELEFNTEVRDTFGGLEMDGNAAALSTLFRDGQGKFSSSARSYSGEGRPRGTGIGNDLAAAAERLELPPDLL